MKTGKKPSFEIRQLSRDVHLALILDEWPSGAAQMDFGLVTQAHYAALQEAVKQHGVTLEQLDRALGRGEALTRLIGPENRYHGLKFESAWDELMPSFEELQALSKEEFDELEEPIRIRYFYELEDRQARDEPAKTMDWKQGETEQNCLLLDVESWSKRYPGMPSVEVAREQEDPVLLMKTDDNLPEYGEPGTSFYVAGYSTDGIPVYGHTSGGSLCVMSVTQFMNGGATRFFGLLLDHQKNEMRLEEIDDDLLSYEGPGSLQLWVDQAWQPRRLSEVIGEHPEYEMLTDDDRVRL